MKKIFLILITMFIFSECYAFEYEYSEWSPIYPGKVKDEIFIEEEDRFLWYREVEKDIKYMRIDDIGNYIKYDSNDIKYETNYMFTEPIKYKERTYKRIFKDYVFSNFDIDGILFNNIGNINISEVEIYLNKNKFKFDSSHKELIDGKYEFINYKDKNIKINKPKNCIKIGIVGELYSIMEPYCSSNVERKLASLGIEVHRFTTLTYLLFIKKYKLKYYLHKGKKYLKYHLGADATESVVLSNILAKKHYDGIVHIKSFGCTPELNAMPILEKISLDYNIPIIYFSFDANDNETGYNTRIEAFYDMLVQKKNKQK